MRLRLSNRFLQARRAVNRQRGTGRLATDGRPGLPWIARAASAAVSGCYSLPKAEVVMHKSGEEMPRYLITDPAEMRQAAGIYRRLGSDASIAQAETLETAAVTGLGVILADRQWRIVPPSGHAPGHA